MLIIQSVVLRRIDVAPKNSLPAAAGFVVPKALLAVELTPVVHAASLAILMVPIPDVSG